MTDTQPKFFGRYRIVRPLARGGMGQVLLAEDPHMQRLVAIKIMPREASLSEEWRARFEREAETIASLEGLAVVPVYDFGEEDGQPYLVMRYMPGGTLGQWLASAPQPAAEVVRIARPIARALDALHAKGIIHRDLKPANILLDDDHNPFIADFGIVKNINLSMLTIQPGKRVFGTPEYISPEQAAGAKVLDHRSDLYSFGILLYHMLTGDYPYRATNPYGYIRHHLSTPIPDIREKHPDLPAATSHVFFRALAKPPTERYPSATRLVDDLERSLQGEPAIPNYSALRSSLYTIEPAAPAATVAEPTELLYPPPDPDAESGRAGRARFPVIGAALAVAGILIAVVAGIAVFQTDGNFTGVLPFSIPGIARTVVTASPTSRPSLTPSEANPLEMPLADVDTPTGTPAPPRLPADINLIGSLSLGMDPDRIHMVMDVNGDAHFVWWDHPKEFEDNLHHRIFYSNGAWSEPIDLTPEIDRVPEDSVFLLLSNKGYPCVFFTSSSAVQQTDGYYNTRCYMDGNWYKPTPLFKTVGVTGHFFPAYAPDGGLHLLAINEKARLDGTDFSDTAVADLVFQFEDRLFLIDSDNGYHLFGTKNRSLSHYFAPPNGVLPRQWTSLLGVSGVQSFQMTVADGNAVTLLAATDTALDFRYFHNTLLIWKSIPRDGSADLSDAQLQPLPAQWLAAEANLNSPAYLLFNESAASAAMQILQIRRSGWSLLPYDYTFPSGSTPDLTRCVTQLTPLREIVLGCISNSTIRIYSIAL